MFDEPVGGRSCLPSKRRRGPASQNTDRAAREAFRRGKEKHAKDRSDYPAEKRRRKDALAAAGYEGLNIVT